MHRIFRDTYESEVEDLRTKPETSAPAAHTGAVYARGLRSPLFATTLLVTLLVVECGLLIFEANKKHFWYDELLTLHNSNLQPFSLFWKALKAGSDGMPLGYYLFARAARVLPADPQVTLRLPSILGYLMTLLGVYWFARKRLPAAAGLAAALLVALSPFREYALEARGYALLVGFLALSAVLWQRIDEQRFMTPLFAVFLSLAVCCHHLAVVTISVFAMAEVTWTLLFRRIRWGVWAACLLAATPFFMSIPLLRHYRDIFGKNFWSQPSWGATISSYGFYFGIKDAIALVLIAFFGIVVAGLFLRNWRTRGSLDERGFGLPEIVLISGFLYYPVLLFVLTKLQHSGYTPRYAWPAILGLVLGSVYLLRTVWRDELLSTYILVALVIGLVFSDARNLYRARSTRADELWTSLAELSRGEPNVPVVIGSPLIYLEAVQYSPPELRDRLVNVVDEDMAKRLIGTDTPDKTNRLLAQFVPLGVEDLAPFEKVHPRFMILSGGGLDWFTQYLLEKRYSLRLVSNDSGIASKHGDTKIYLAER